MQFIPRPTVSWRGIMLMKVGEVQGTVYVGDLPRRALSMVREWLAIHRAEIETDWQLACERKPLNQIEPLE